jgi:hypothetical protein
MRTGRTQATALTLTHTLKRRMKLEAGIPSKSVMICKFSIGGCGALRCVVA